MLKRVLTVAEVRVVIGEGLIPNEVLYLLHSEFVRLPLAYASTHLMVEKSACSLQFVYRRVK